MKKVFVYDVAAESGGALSILNDFYEFVTNTVDMDIHWFIMVSNVDLHETDNVSIIRYPQAKKSWAHRLWCDYVHAPSIVKKIAPDIIFSMQNILMHRTKIPQVLYMHQPVPFTDIKFNFKESKMLWIYQNILDKPICKSVIKADAVVLQTEWIAKAVSQKTGKSINDFLITMPPIPVINTDLPYCENEARHTFFYPASAITYKNHKQIINAVNLLKNKGITDFEVLLTVTKEQLNKIGISEQNDNVRCIGRQSRDNVMTIYKHSTLIFPSKLETFGLPLLEARMCDSFVLAIDMPYCHEILKDYSNVEYFNLDDAKSLATCMESIMNGNKMYSQNNEMNFFNQNIGWKSVCKLLIDVFAAKHKSVC